ncbi:MAG: TldD/PmbA family protein [Rickettsiales bacterium]
MTTTLSHLDALESLITKAKAAGATAADAVMFDSTDISCSCRKGKPESVERAESTGLGLRVFMGQKIAIVSSSDTRDATLQELVDRAVAMAKESPEDPFAALAAPEQLATHIPELDLFDGDEPSPEWLAETCKRTEEAALAIDGITNSEGANAAYSANRIALVTSNGFAQGYPTSSFMASVAVIAGKGDKMERDYDYSVSRHREDLASPEAIGQKAAQNTLARLNPRKAKSCKVPIVFDPKIAKGLIATFAGAISGASVARGTTFLKDYLGKEVFAPGITIVDDPHIVRALGSRPFDAEGVGNKRRNLVENGVIQSWLLDIRTAKKLGLQTLGDAARGTASPPMPSTSNLYLEPGSLSPEALMADIKEGLYITETFGSGSNLVTGDVSVGAAGFWIENGQKAYPVSEITIAGNLKDMYKNLIPASDLTFKYATNAPTVRIDGMTVAGT